MEGVSFQVMSGGQFSRVADTAHDPLNPGVARERPVVPGSPFELPFKVGQERGNPIHSWVRGGRDEVVQIAGPG